MAAPTMSRPGQVGSSVVGTAADIQDALFLKQFSGEVMTAFEEANIMMPLHTVRTISGGRSTTFPTIGIAGAAYHDPGEDILDTGDTSFEMNGGAYGTQFKHNEVVLSIDKLLLSTTFIPEIEELMLHYDVRSYYSKEMGNALAYAADKHLIITAVKASQSTTPVNADYSTNGAWQDNGGGGDTFVRSDNLKAASGSFVTQFITAMYACAQRFDELSVPSTDRFCIISPAHYYKLFNQSSGAGPVIVNRDTGNTTNGSLQRPAEYLELAGIKIFKSIHVPKTNISSSTNIDKYTGDFTKLQGIVFQRQAIGTVKLMDLSMQSEYRIDRQGTLMVARYAMGHGILRPECAIALTSVTAT